MPITLHTNKLHINDLKMSGAMDILTYETQESLDAIQAQIDPQNGTLTQEINEFQTNWEEKEEAIDNKINAVLNETIPNIIQIIEGTDGNGGIKGDLNTFISNKEKIIGGENKDGAGGIKGDLTNFINNKKNEINKTPDGIKADLTNFIEGKKNEINNNQTGIKIDLTNFIEEKKVEIGGTNKDGTGGIKGDLTDFIVDKDGQIEQIKQDIYDQGETVLTNVDQRLANSVDAAIRAADTVIVSEDVRNMLANPIDLSKSYNYGDYILETESTDPESPAILYKFIKQPDVPGWGENSSYTIATTLANDVSLLKTSEPLSQSNEYGWLLRENVSIIKATGGIALNQNNYIATVNYFKLLKGDIIRFNGLYGRAHFYNQPTLTQYIGYSSENPELNDIVMPYDAYVRFIVRNARQSDGTLENITTQEVFDKVEIIQRQENVKGLVKKNLITKEFERTGIQTKVRIKPLGRQIWGDIIGQSIVYTTTNFIPVFPDIRYDLKYAWDLKIIDRINSATGEIIDSRGDWAIKVIAYDKDYQMVHPIERINTDGTTNIIYGLYYYEPYNDKNLNIYDGKRVTSFVFEDDIKFIQICYPKVWTTDIEFKAFVPPNYLDNSEAILYNKYFNEKNHPSKIQEFLDVMDTYYNLYTLDEEGKYKWLLHYEQNYTATSEIYHPGAIDCSGFVGLILRGKKLEDTLYAQSFEPSQTIDPDDSSEGDENEKENTNTEDNIDENGEPTSTNNSTPTLSETQTAEIPGDPITERNENYDWSIDLGHYFTPFYDLQVCKNHYSRTRSAAQVCQFFEENGRQIQLDAGFINLQPGDILFFARRRTDLRLYPDVWVQPNRYKHISHIAFVYSKELIDHETEDTNKIVTTYFTQDGNGDIIEEPRKYKHLIIEVAGDESGDDIIGDPVITNNIYQGVGNYSPCKKRYLERKDFAGMYKNGVDTLVSVCRPDLGFPKFPEQNSNN